MRKSATIAGSSTLATVSNLPATTRQKAHEVLRAIAMQVLFEMKKSGGAA